MLIPFAQADHHSSLLGHVSPESLNGRAALGGADAVVVGPGRMETSTGYELERSGNKMAIVLERRFPAAVATVELSGLVRSASPFLLGSCQLSILMP